MATSAPFVIEVGGNSAPSPIVGVITVFTFGGGAFPPPVHAPRIMAMLEVPAGTRNVMLDDAVAGSGDASFFIARAASPTTWLVENTKTLPSVHAYELVAETV